MFVKHAFGSCAKDFCIDLRWIGKNQLLKVYNLFVNWIFLTSILINAVLHQQVQMSPSTLHEFVKAAKFLKLNGFEGVDAGIGIEDRPQKTNRKRSFALKLKRMDTSQAPAETANETNNATLDANIEMNNVTSTMNTDDGKFFPSSESDGSDGKNQLFFFYLKMLFTRRTFLASFLINFFFFY